MSAVDTRLPRCPDSDCCYFGQASASSCACADDEPTLCPDCSGSGEGRFDGTTCRACHGAGEIKVTQ